MRWAVMFGLAASLVAGALFLRRGPAEAPRAAATPSSPPAMAPSPGPSHAPRPLPPSTASSGALIRGHVVHGTTPMDGAEVVLGTLDLHRKGMIVSEPDFRRTTSGPLGYFEFADVSRGRYRISSGLGDLAPAIADAEVKADDRIVDVRLELQPGLSLDLEVVHGGTPVEGATVELWISVAGTEYGRMGRPLRTAKTPESGKLRFAGIPRDAAANVLIRKDGFAPAEELVGPFLVSLYRRVDLFSGFEIWGSVRDSEGRAIEGADVEATQGGAYSVWGRPEDDGVFRIRGLRNGPIRLSISRDGFLPANLDLPGPKLGFVVTLQRPGGLAGTAPEGSVRVVVSCGSASFVRPLEGTLAFRWEAIPPGPATLRAEDAQGRELARLEVRIPEGGVLEVGAIHGSR